MTHKGGTNTTKDVIYIDVDDEITAVIEKVQASEKKIVALVLPKRATVLQSIVNMKLLKRAAAETTKSLVLITSEASLMPLAGSIGMHVAKSLNSKPEVPSLPGRMPSKSEREEVVEAELDDAPLDAAKTVGELSGGAMAQDKFDDEAETIELDDEDEAQASTDKSSKKGKLPKLKKFRIPNFDKFRVLMVLAIVGVLLLGAVGYAAVAVWPKAVITIKTDSTSVDVSATLALKTPAETTLDTEKDIIPAQSQEVKKTLKADAPATGQRNDGDKAVGSVTMNAKNCSSLTTPDDVPAGTGITAHGKTYITQERASFKGSGSYDGACLNFEDKNISIVAQGAGASYNVDSAEFIVAGRVGITATGSAAGGTDKVTKIVSQADIDAAKQKIAEQDTGPIQDDLKSALVGRGLLPIDATFSASDPETKLSAEANAEADSVTVTQTITYGMLGVMQSDLEKVIGALAEKQIDTKKQGISSYGVNSATFNLQESQKDGATVAMQTTAIAGAQLDVSAIKKQVAGKKAGDAQDLISANPGVTDVQVTYSPFWVSSIPKNTSKITVTVEQPKATSQHAESP